MHERNRVLHQRVECGGEVAALAPLEHDGMISSVTLVSDLGVVDEVPAFDLQQISGRRGTPPSAW
jgi:hypothetical protein